MKKLLVVGHGRHGKDTVCEILRDYHGYSFGSSSEFCAERVVFPVLREIYMYNTWVECFEDRHNHRAEWYDIIREFNTPDKSRLPRALLEEYDIYCGMRCDQELSASRNLFDEVWWVDRSDHLPLEPYDSMKIEYDPRKMRWIDNNRSLAALWRTIDNVISFRD